MIATPPTGMQIPFDFHRNQSAQFDTYFAGGNSEVVVALRSLAGDTRGQSVYLWGSTGTGKTHLLQALCSATLAHRSAPLAFLPLREAVNFGPEMCEGVATRSLVCVDDIDHIAGRQDWEQALFALYNAARDGSRTLVVSGTQAPRESSINLPDLRSRLSWGLVYQLKPLTDEDKHALVIERARARNLDLDEEVVEYILRRLPRDVGGLCAFIDRVDTASLSAHRHVTIPFVKWLLDAR